MKTWTKYKHTTIIQYNKHTTIIQYNKHTTIIQYNNTQR